MCLKMSIHHSFLLRCEDNESPETIMDIICLIGTILVIFEHEILLWNINLISGLLIER